MENLIWAVLLWTVVLVLIPLERLKELWIVGVVSFIWFFTIEFFFLGWGYYRFTHILISVAGVPIIQTIGATAGGILLMNWMHRNSLFKVALVTGFSGLLNLSEYIFIRLNAFVYGHGFNPLISFIQSVAMLSILVWVTLALVGPEKIYGGNKTRFTKRYS